MRKAWDKSRTGVTFCAYDKPGAHGGPVSWASDLSAFLCRMEIPLHMLVLCPGGFNSSALAKGLSREGVEVDVLDTSSTRYLEDEVEWIVEQWERRQHAVLLANLVLPALFAGKWIRKSGGKTVGVFHSPPSHDAFYADTARYFVAGDPAFRLDAAVVVSRDIASQLRAIAPASVAVAQIACGTRVPDELATKPTGVLKLLYAGRLTEKAKRFRDVTEALIRASSLAGVTATIVGDGEERAWLENRLGGSKAVSYLGPVDPQGIHEIMSRHHAIVVLSDFEGMPIALVEGMACGLVPIGLDIPGGVSEAIEHGVNGLLVKNRDEAFVEAVSELRDGGTWGRLSAAARNTAVERYSHRSLFPKWLELINNLQSNTASQGDSATVSRPGRIRLPKMEHAFSGYPKARPPLVSSVRESIRSRWGAVRRAMRPRARIRTLVSRLSGAGDPPQTRRDAE